MKTFQMRECVVKSLRCVVLKDYVLKSFTYFSYEGGILRQGSLVVNSEGSRFRFGEFEICYMQKLVK